MSLPCAIPISNLLMFYLVGNDLHLILASFVMLRRDKYYLVDLGFTNSRGFLAPYRGTRYHLNLWRGNTPTNYKELFNLRHSSARNTIERAFGVLKKRWTILRTTSFFDKKTQVRIINACFILHNFVRDKNMEENDLLREVDEELENTNTFDSDNEVDVDYITST
ncbi:protein ALP1-like [Asparagus officinalis]|uniref:protein ALP1-like n=1 Tax=Asparagus officinalis TaxID=4686 RepID=UPI00098DE82D|nr:protein ALP1-like [Asparagus officinalis]